MATVLKTGPADHGQPMTLDEFMGSDFEKGYHYELIDGRLYVSPLPEVPSGLLESWIYWVLKRYCEARPGILNFVYNKARVFVPGRRGVTTPEPDVAAYRDFPLHKPFRKIRWQDVSPLLVVEVISPDDPHKDLIRNVALYLQVPSIREYWVLDPREDPERPSLIVYRRRGRKWQPPIEVPAGETYTTRLLPGFELVLDPRR